jgi:phosphotransferase system, enzyme I, PtsP
LHNSIGRPFGQEQDRTFLMRAPGGPRLLLRRLREVMAEPVTAQARLDRIVVLIASNMVAEVCSLYVVRADGVMELFATEGLNREAVHLTIMRPGEGLVGLIASSAEALALSDARHHPAFSYKPETGEEIYQSFLGVPVLRNGATIGVLVVQNRARRAYSEEEIEALQTTAMLLAEMIASGELQGIAAQGAPIAVRRALSLKGAGIADGLGLGHVVMHQPRVAVSKIVADDVDSELIRLETAIGAMRASVDNLIDRSDDGVTGEHRDVLEAFRMIAHDRGWLRRLREAVSSGVTAEAAVERVQNDARAKLQRQTDPYLRDRLHDLTDIANRLMHQLAGQSLVLLPDELPENAILVARSMSPAALLDYDRARLRGLVLEEAGAASHIAIVARALAIPAVSDIPNISEIVEHGDPIIVDGDAGEIHLRPPSDVEAAYAEKARMRARKQAQFRALRDAPTISLDGVSIGLHMNAGLLVDMPHLAETGAKSIGLFRTELQFMLASRFPRPGAQVELYRAILDAAGDRPVTFRTLDIGGDKLLPYMKGFEEENPALGWRALRIGLDRPALLRMQLRAFVRAAAGRDLRVMAPMVSTVDEFQTVRAMFDRELAWIASRGDEPPRTVSLGVMVEVPSLLWQIDEIAAAADFLSVGSNDLMQYLYAVDRDNKRVADRFDPLSVGFLRALRAIAEAGERKGTPVTLCGEIGGRPLEAMALMAIGYRELSMSATSIGPVKAMTLTLNVGEATREVEAMLATGREGASLRQSLLRLAERLGVRL